MATALDLIKAAMRKAGVLTKTESPSADEAADGLSSLNAMLESWSCDGINVAYRTLESHVLTSGTSNYTIGDGGDIDTVRPVIIVSAYIRDGSTDYPVGIIGDEKYAAKQEKSTTGIPEELNYTAAYPLGVINLYPAPSSAYTLFILSEKTIGGGYSLSSTVSLPNGWERAIVHNLAVEIAPEYGQQVPNEVAVIALDSMSLLRRSIVKNRPIECFDANSSIPDVYSGYIR